MIQSIGKPVIVLGLKIFVIMTAPDANENAPSSGAPIRFAISRSNLIRSASASVKRPSVMSRSFRSRNSLKLSPIFLIDQTGSAELKSQCELMPVKTAPSPAPTAIDTPVVAETGAFLKQRPQADLATQSGPMLVINGRLHPRFDRRSTSLKARNGVGVRADGKVIIVLSQGEVSFDAFARLFRDGLNCPNALFLDGGSAASLYAPSLNSHGNIVSLGPMLAVFERNRGASRQ